jgi:hypothetical protein
LDPDPHQNEKQDPAQGDADPQQCVKDVRVGKNMNWKKDPERREGWKKVWIGQKAYEEDVAKRGGGGTYLVFPVGVVPPEPGFRPSRLARWPSSASSRLLGAWYSQQALR